MAFSLLGLTYILSTVTAVSSSANNIFRNAAEVADHAFDYIVVGGGTTGLTVAARLSENPKIHVLVIESGAWEHDRGPEVHNLTYYGRQFGTAMDHGFQTRPQTADARVHHINSGRGLGGSTLINGGAWTRPAKIQIDAWQSVFGNDGWTWDELLPHMKRVEAARAPYGGVDPDSGESCHGTSGPVQLGPFDTGGGYSPIIQAFKDVAKERDLPLDNDLSCGNPRGVSTFPVTVTVDGQRCDAGRSWLLPILDRPNIRVLTGQDVGKVLLDTSSGIPKATGVQYGRYKAEMFEAHAKVEVIIAAGALASPLILESSGIGLSTVLASAGIEQVLDLPVGVNHQDQTNTNVVNLPSPEGLGQGQVAYFASFNETFGELASKGHEMLANDVLLQQWADTVVASGGSHNASVLMMQWRNYIDHIEHHDVAYSELLLDTWGEFGFSVWNLLPFGRGYIHVRSSDPYLRDYEYDPQFLSTELDVLAQASASRLARKLSDEGGLAKFRQLELRPGLDEIPNTDDIASWRKWVNSNYRANLHAVGTCSMMRRELGGVVNNRAQVYGVEGLRVVDASILPTQVSSHMMALLYGVADKIAGHILEDHAEAAAEDHEEL
jgi:choline dehydrogenase-like flavoprotein